jgi:transcriptional regulator with XRE-family HTH domain
MFWETFNEICEKNNTKPNTVARSIGVSSATCTKWKNGTIPNGETLLKLADYFKVSIDYLLGRTNEPNGNIQIGTETPNYGTTANEMIAIFNSLRFEDKVKVMSLVAELSEKKGA